jgi:hypothetical protein
MIIVPPNTKEFIIDEYPVFNPISQHFERISYYKEQKRNSIEGKWIDGWWMPGVLYFYVNVFHILLGGKGNAGKKLGRPLCRDLEWDKGRIAVEARGFSGFADDPEVTCNELLTYSSKKKLEEDKLLDTYIRSGYIREEDLNKTYEHPRTYLARQHKSNYGKPLFQNEAKNVIDLECREGGKSYWAANMIAHNFLFDGAYDYDLYLEAKQSKQYLTSDTLIGAIHTKYSSDLLSKFKLGFDNLPGKVEYRGVTYESPFMVQTEGSLQPGKTYRSLEDDKVKSKIHHVTFKDNPLAGNGLRASLVLIEEVGFMDNIEETLGALKESVSQSGRQFGSIYMFGTGGLSKGVALNYTKTIFNSPATYNCLEFDDVYEHKGKIGYFIPKHLGLNQFKEGELLVTNWEKAEKFLNNEFEKTKGDKLKQAMELINNPRLPSHMFLTIEGIFFPTIDLKNRLSELEADRKELDETEKGFVVINEKGEYTFKRTEDKPIRTHPHKVTSFSQGCVEIFERPVYNVHGEIPSGIYIAGCDPVDDDDLKGSLQSAFIINKLTRRIVAEYTARHETAKEYWENLRRLLIFYNAKCNYENAKKGLWQYFENTNSTYLLIDTPKILKEQSIISKSRLTGNKAVGTPASLQVNQWARNLIKQWLMEPMFSNPELANLSHIKTPAFLEELITWNPDGNFDRISAMGMALIALEDKLKINIDLEKPIENNSDKYKKFLNDRINGTSIENISRTKITF